MSIKKKKCIAIYNKECYNSLKFLSNQFNIKLFNKINKDVDFDIPINPFGISSYWVDIYKIKIDLDIAQWKINNTAQLYVYEKLITSNEFKKIPNNITIKEFESHFSESVKVHNDYNYIKNQIFKRPTETTNLIPNIPIKLINAELNRYYYKTETKKEYLKRCVLKYNTDFIYKIILNCSYKDVEFEYSEMPSESDLTKNPNLPPIKIWKQINQVANQSDLHPLRELVIELCNRLEDNNILNYAIGLDFEEENMHVAETQYERTSFHNYPDQYGLDGKNIQ